MVETGCGKPEDYEFVPQQVESALARLANRARIERMVVFADDGKTIVREGKCKKELWVYQTPGTPFFRHYNELRNAQDDFVKYFVDHDEIGKNPVFLAIVNRIKVCLKF